MCADVTSFKRGGNICFEGAEVGKRFAALLRPLRDMHIIGHDVVATMAAVVTASSSPSGVCLRLARCTELREEVAKPRRTKESARVAEEGPSEDASDSDVEFAVRRAKDAASGDSCCSVDTLLDSGDEAQPLLKKKKDSDAALADSDKVRSIGSLARLDSDDDASLQDEEPDESGLADSGSEEEEREEELVNAPVRILWKYIIICLNNLVTL